MRYHRSKSEEFVLFLAMIFLVLAADVALDDERRCLVSDRSDKVAAQPEFTAPEPVPDPRKFIEALLSRDALRGFYDLGGSEARGNGDEDVAVVFPDVLLNDLKPICRGYLREEVFKKFFSLRPRQCDSDTSMARRNDSLIRKRRERFCGRPYASIIAAYDAAFIPLKAGFCERGNKCSTSWDLLPHN